MKSAAQKAGLHPSEFWDLTPIEVSSFVEDATKADLTRAWTHALLQRMDAKKFPKSPDKLWAEAPTPEEQELQLLDYVKSLKRSRDNASRKRKKPVTFMREE